MNTNEPDLRALVARRLVRKALAEDLNHLLSSDPLTDEPGAPSEDPQEQLPPIPRLPVGFRFTPHDLPPDIPHGRPPLGKSSPLKVCIVGAGVAGLYIAMILDDLDKVSPGLITYDILEASPSRAGGRLYTHRFSEAPHDYYDVGAMRYPKIASMGRTFDLFARTHLHLIPYYLEDPQTPSLFNDRFFAPGPDPYRVSIRNGGAVPDDVVDRVGEILDGAFGPYKAALHRNFDEGFEKLMTVDGFSTREFLKRGGPQGTQPQYNALAIQWMETQNTATNLFDQAFSESVMDSFDFDNPQRHVDWYCIEGGTGRLVDAMQATLSNKVQLGKRVEAISIGGGSGDEGDHYENVSNMSVKCAGDDKPLTGYSTVFATTTLGCLGRMDLRTLELHPAQKAAIRSLHYDDSTKVALKFSYPWWIVDCGLKKGGVATTDLPLRSCVYPSYNLHDGAGKPAVLLASYTWSQDATRMGSLVNDEAQMVELLLRDLARLHEGHGATYEKIRKAFVSHHAYSWSHDPNTAGAFALFGPGQFSNLYPYLTRPAADGKFHIVGEAASAHHAWIVGALDSAYAAVHRFLHRFHLREHIQALQDRWGSVAELETGTSGTLHLQVLLARSEHAAKLRQLSALYEAQQETAVAGR